MSGSTRDIPQSTRDAGTNSGAIDLYYTNEDIAILHNIVVAAQESLPTLPERHKFPTNALFQAYHDILPRFGVDVDHDSRYARFLFKIGGLRGEGTLYEKFEEILARLGIEVEFSSAEHDSDLQEDDQSQLVVEDSVEWQIQEHHRPWRQRRSSESTAWDFSMPLQAEGRKRHQSCSPPARPENRSDRILQTAMAPLLPLPELIPPFPVRDTDGDVEAGRKVRTWLNSKEDPPLRGRNRSLSTQTSLRVRRRSLSTRLPQQTPRVTPSIPPSDADGYQAADEETAVTSAEEEANPNPNIALQRWPFARASYQLMKTKATVILQHHLSNHILHIVRSWRIKAMQLRTRHTILHNEAHCHDSDVLFRQALQTWHDRLVEKRQIAETEGFFAHLERRAERARDLYLIAKAFTHWTACALEQAQLTTVARRHIVRFRIFNAWREITVANALKVRRKRLKKFLRVWRQQNMVNAAKIEMAHDIYQANLVKTIYQTWFREHFALQFTSQCGARALWRMLQTWIIVAQDIQANQDFANYESRRRLSGKIWHIWDKKSRDRSGYLSLASDIYNTEVTRVTLKKWHRETSTVPAKNIVVTEVRGRLTREFFSIWLHRTRQTRQGAVFDRMKILREALITWRHEVRCKRQGDIVVARALSSAFSKWILSKSSKAYTEIRNERLVRRCLSLWIYEMHVTRDGRWKQEDQAEGVDVQAIWDRVLSIWGRRLQASRESERQAIDFHTTRLLSRVILKWREHVPYQIELERDCRKAEFWFVIRKALKLWKSATEASKRQKRKAAYIQVRQMMKMNLAGNVLSEWHHSARRTIDLHAQAREMSHNKNIIVGMNTFDRWRARAEEISELEAICKERILTKHLLIWNDHFMAFQNLNSEAVISFEEGSQSRALKKWSLRTLQLNSQAISALEVRERNAKRHCRKIFTYWQQRTTQRRPVIRADSHEEQRLGATVRAETWLDFGKEVQLDDLARRFRETPRNLEESNAPPQTPMPGYLATPSKRMERIQAATARFGSTTPKVPLSTLIEKELRAQWSGLSVPRRGRGANRSILGRSTLDGGFKDIPERETGATDDKVDNG